MSQTELDEKIHLNLRVSGKTKKDFEDKMLDVKKEHGTHIKVTGIFRALVDKTIEDPEKVLEFLKLI